MKQNEEVIHDHERFKRQGKKICPHCGKHLVEG